MIDLLSLIPPNIHQSQSKSLLDFCMTRMCVLRYPVRE